jgi:hypothetical protein
MLWLVLAVLCGWGLFAIGIAALLSLFEQEDEGPC